MTVVDLQKKSDRDTLEGYEPLLLSSQDLVNTYWGATAPLLEKVVEESMHGEMTVQDMYDSVLAGRFYAFVLKNDEGESPDVAFVLILEINKYPQLNMMNIVALGGRQLDLLRSKYWSHICGWAYMNGARQLEALVSPNMERVLEEFGFKEVYKLVRLDLTEM